MNLSDPADRQDWQFCRFGLIVTGRAEEDFLPRLFRSISASGRCSFKVIGRIDQWPAFSDALLTDDRSPTAGRRP